MAGLQQSGMSSVKIEELYSNSEEEEEDFQTPSTTPTAAQAKSGHAFAKDSQSSPSQAGPSHEPPLDGVKHSGGNEGGDHAKSSQDLREAGDSNLADDEDPFPNEEEEKALAEADALKKEGNEHHNAGKYLEAVAAYEEAVRIAPERALQEKATYHANASQSYLKLEHWKEAVREASASLKLEPKQSIKLKALQRRAQAYEELKDYMRAAPDYEKMLEVDSTNQHAKSQLKRLKPLVEAEQERTKEEMLSKLKELGNTVLGKFGMSLDNFKAEKDPSTGQYSISMTQ